MARLYVHERCPSRRDERATGPAACTTRSDVHLWVIRMYDAQRRPLFSEKKCPPRRDVP
jgi:hypothetical protein